MKLPKVFYSVKQWFANLFRGWSFLANGLRFNNYFLVEHIRKGVLIASFMVPNGIVDVGLNHILDTEFHGSSQVTTWYISLVDNSGWTAFANADTMSSHTGWTEFTSYDESTRVEWTEGAASARAITNGTAITFTINATGTLKGIFVTSGSAKSGTSGTLWATAAFASTVPVVDDDQIKITYTVSG